MNKHLEYQVGTNQDGSSSNHYKNMKIEPMEFILANSTIEELRGILRFSVTKYCWRDKDNMVEDWTKAKHYIEMITEELNNRSIPVPITDEVMPDRRELIERRKQTDKQLWNFPVTIFAGTKTQVEQLAHMASEAKEFLNAYNDPDVSLEDALDEATDFVHSYHTYTNIKGCETHAKRSQDRVEVKNSKRNYYNES